MYTTGTYQSLVLRRPNHFTAVLPENMNDSTKNLFLLHGFNYDENSWLHYTPLKQYAEKYNVAFFCPDAGISFYTDHSSEENYGEAIGEEFYQVMAKTFSVSMTKENTAIAGFSMGGYGAILLGLRYADYYSMIGGFSPAFVFYKKSRQEPHFNQVFSKGDYGSENDCVLRYQQLLDLEKEIPFMDITCGVEDPLLKPTLEFIEEVKQIDPQFNYDLLEQPGFHDFGLWQGDLERFLEKFASQVKKTTQ
jgi:putative tributyrin esterase